MRIVARLLVLLPLLWVEGVWAVECNAYGYQLSEQRDVDAIGETGCNVIRGNLTITGGSNITNLDGLINLTRVGLLEILHNDALTNIDGLSNLTSVDGRLWINNNSSLVNLDGLAKLASIGGDLSITNSAALTHIDGLANLTSVAGPLVITHNALLSNLDGFIRLSSVGDNLQVGWNSALTDMSGLANLTSIGGDMISVISNAVLQNLDGLVALTNVAGDLQIISNGLADIDGLSNVTSIAGDLTISTNPSLADLDGLANLTNINGNLLVEFNSSLANCQGIAPLLGWPSVVTADNVGGDIIITRNVTGCNSAQQILASVSGASQPIINRVTTSSTSISVRFIPSTTTDTAFPVTGHRASCTGSDIGVSGSPTSDLLDITPIQETLTVAGYDPTAVLSSIEVDINITHSDPTDLYITLTTPEGTELILWNQGSSGGEDLIGTFPTTLTAVDSLDSVTRQTMDGDWVLSIEDIDVGPIVWEGVLNSWGVRITEQLTRNGSGTPIEVFGATRGRDYTCTVAPVTKLGTTPVSDPYTVTVPLELPSVPTITSTDYEDGKIILTVSVSDNGGTDITGYDATCTDGTNTYTSISTSSPITVSGLTNDVAYTCTVTATNSVGTSSASAATDPITPEEASTGLPIWLLYEATQ